MSGESTRCWDTEGLTSVVATRARWRVGSYSSNMLVTEDWEGEGERGKTGDGGMRTGNVVVADDDEDAEEGAIDGERSSLD